MKKAVAVLAIISLLLFLSNFAYAETEISFQNIPWLSDDITTMNALKSIGILRDGTQILALSDEESVVIVENEMLNYQPKGLSEYKDYCYSISFHDYVKGKIADCPIKNIILTFAYNGEFELISVKVDLLNIDFVSLKEKLCRVYGEGDEKTLEEGIESIVWKGNNNSGVLLYTESEGYDYQLVYGRLDAEEILKKCTIMDKDDVSGL